MERTEEDKITQSPLTVTLGGKEYEVKPLVIRDSRAWRKKAAPFLASVAKYAGAKTDDPEELGRIIIELLTERIDQTCDLFFEYAKDLPREEIEGKATDLEMLTAWNGVQKLAFPFGLSPIVK